MSTPGEEQNEANSVPSRPRRSHRGRCTPSAANCSAIPPSLSTRDHQSFQKSLGGRSRTTVVIAPAADPDYQAISWMLEGEDEWGANWQKSLKQHWEQKGRPWVDRDPKEKKVLVEKEVVVGKRCRMEDEESEVAEKDAEGAWMVGKVGDSDKQEEDEREPVTYDEYDAVGGIVYRNTGV